MQPPALAALKGDALNNLALTPVPSHPPLIEQGKSAGVRARHRAALKTVKESLLPELWKLPLGEALVIWFQRRAEERKWSHATLMREMANFAGAMSDLPLYSNSPVGFKLSECPLWRNGIRQAETAANESACREMPAASVEDVFSAVDLCPYVDTRAAMMLAWLCASRVGCIFQLRADDVVLAENGNLRVSFHRGKGVRFRQPYTVPTKCPAQWLEELAAFLQAAKQRTAGKLGSDLDLFPAKTPSETRLRGVRLTEALRAANPALGQRALRRGALQAMAKDGVPLDTLMVFSGHKRKDTLLRYLGWGRTAEDQAQLGRAAAAALAPRPLVGEL